MQNLLAKSPEEILQAGLHPTFDQLGKSVFMEIQGTVDKISRNPRFKALHAQFTTVPLIGIAMRKISSFFFLRKD